MPECEGKPFHMRNMVALKDLSFPNHIFLNEDWEGMDSVAEPGQRNRAYLAGIDAIGVHR
jgi:hypothetical protein